MPAKITIAVCDDSGEALTAESQMIRQILQKKGVVCTAEEFTSPQELLGSAREYDMVFLDVEMGEWNGIDVGKTILEMNPDICLFFITNYPSYIDEAFDINTHRYLSKPVDINRLSRGIDSALRKLSTMNKMVTVINKEDKERFQIPISSIMYIENMGRNAKIWLINKSVFITRESFSKVKSQIEGEVDYFAVPHQSYYVNTRYVDDYDKNNVIISHEGKTHIIEMSRRGYKSFRNKMFEMAKLLK